MPQEVSFIIVFALYIIALFGDAYANVMPMGAWYQASFGRINTLLFQYTSRNGIMFCSLFIWIGIFLRNVCKDNEKFKESMKIAVPTDTKKWLMIVVLISFSLLAFEMHLYFTFGMGCDANVLISVVPLSVFIFLLGLKLDKLESKFAHILRNCSTIIYVIHPYFIGLCGDITDSSIVNRFIVLIVTILVSLLIVMLSKRIKFLGVLF